MVQFIELWKRVAGTYFVTYMVPYKKETGKQSFHKREGGSTSGVFTKPLTKRKAVFHLSGERSRRQAQQKSLTGTRLCSSYFVSKRLFL